MEQIIEAYDFVYNLDRLGDEITTTRVQSIYEFYRLPAGKKALNKENLVPDIGRKYLVYSGLAEKYYLRILNNEEEIQELKPNVELGTVHLTWDKEQKKEIKQVMYNVANHYGVKKLTYYGQYIPLIENTLQLASYRETGKRDMGFETRCKKYEQERRKLLN